MSVSNRVKRMLDEQKVGYTHHTHTPAYTAQEVAGAEHVPGLEFAKTVMLTDGNEFVMAVLPATRKIDLPNLRKIVGNEKLRLATEDEFKGLFPNCETGAMAPFGNLYDLPVYVDRSLKEDEKITFNAGSHQDTIQISFADYERLVEPEIAEFSESL